MNLNKFIAICLNLQFSFFFFKLYFILCAITVAPVFPLGSPLRGALSLIPQAIPHFCPYPWVMGICSLATLFPMLYFTAPWLFCNYQLVLNSSPFFTHSPTASHLATIKTFSVSKIPVLFCLFTLFFRINC